MSIKEVDTAMRELSITDDFLQTPGWCRYAAQKMAEVADQADQTAPKATKEILVYPSPSEEAEEIHYALRVSSPDQSTQIVYNPNPTGMFPQYLGDFGSAPGYIPRMIVTEKVL